MSRRKHRCFRRKEEALIQMEERGVLLAKSGIRFGYADKLDVWVRWKVM